LAALKGCATADSFPAADDSGTDNRRAAAHRFGSLKGCATANSFPAADDAGSARPSPFPPPTIPVAQAFRPASECMYSRRTSSPEGLRYRRLVSRRRRFRQRQAFIVPAADDSGSARPSSFPPPPIPAAQAFRPASACTHCCQHRARQAFTLQRRIVCAQGDHV